LCQKSRNSPFPIDNFDVCGAGRLTKPAYAVYCGNVEWPSLTTSRGDEPCQTQTPTTPNRQEKIPAISPAESFASINPALRGYLARHNLALAYNDMDRPAEAEAHW
jgi:hypothetical protein